MPRTSERGGPQTRARISRIATALFLERGFDDVTVAEVARQAGVSSVTVFKHFPRKEDLLLDRAPEAAEMLRAALRGASPDADPLPHADPHPDAASHSRPHVVGRALDALEELAVRLAHEQHALSGLAPGAAPFFRAIAGSSALAGRAREIGAELEEVLAHELHRDGVDPADAALAAAFVIAGYGAVLVGTARRVIDGWPEAGLAHDHEARLTRLFASLRHGLT